jgi:hypothetical protein
LSDTIALTHELRFARTIAFILRRVGSHGSSVAKIDNDLSRFLGCFSICAGGVRKANDLPARAPLMAGRCTIGDRLTGLIA